MCIDIHSFIHSFVTGVHTKNLVAILHLLVALARHFRAPIRLPENVCVTLLVVQKVDGQLQTRRITEEITSTNE
jgi:parvin